jgi:hypothetical protein
VQGVRTFITGDAAVNLNYPTQEEIRSRAQQICLERGGQPNHEIDDWLQAEYELMQLPVRKLAELEPREPEKGARVSVVSLVQVAVFLRTEALLHSKR